MVGTRHVRRMTKSWSLAAALAVALAMVGALLALPAGAALAGQGAYTGTVLLPNGTPAPGVTVELLDADEWYAGPKSTATTAADGTYEVSADAGTYLIRFVDPSGDHLWSFHQGEYASATPDSISAARGFPVAAGETVEVDHTLIASGSLRGKVTLPADVLPADVSVIVWHPRRPMGMAPRVWVQGGKVAADGTYAIPLLDGDYVLEITHGGDLLRELSIPVRVDAPTVTRVDVAPRRTASISGVVRVPAGSDEENVRITPHTLQVDSEGNYYWYVGESVVVRAGEPYRIAGLSTGNYRLEFGPESSTSNLAPSYWPSASFVDQGEDIPLLDGSDRAGIDGELAVGGEVTGRLDPALGLTPETGSIELWRQATIVGGSATWERANFAQPIAADGSFRITGVAAGRFRLKVVKDALEVFHPAATTLEEGADFDVALGETTSGIDVRVPAVQPTPVPSPEPKAKKIKRAKAPKVTGKAKVGKRLKVSKGTWKPKSVKVKYRWFTKNGKKAVKVKSKAGKKSKLKLKKSMRGKKYRVVVTVSKKGYKTVKFTSKWSKKVKK